MEVNLLTQLTQIVSAAEAFLRNIGKNTKGIKANKRLEDPLVLAFSRLINSRRR